MSQPCMVLGCFGLITDGFVLCAGLENKILSIDASINDYNKLMDYFDSCRLFDKPAFEFSAINHVINNIQANFDRVNKRVWTEKHFELYQKFVINHRHCGLYLKLVLEEEGKEIGSKVVEKTVFVKGATDIAPKNEENNTPKLTLLRGKR